MSRPLLILIVLLLVLVGGLYALSTMATEVAPTEVVRDVPKERLAR